jgi:hypothetical protein
LWTEEVTFTRNGLNSLHNIHKQALENPDAAQCCSFDQRYSVNIRAGIIDDYLTGPYMIVDHFGGIQYTDSPKRILPLLLVDVHMTVCKGMGLAWWCPSPLFTSVHNWLNNYFLTLGLAVRVESSGLHILI